MNSLQINKTEYITSELKSWLRMLAFVALGVIIAKFIFGWPFEKQWLVIAAPVLLKLGDTFTQYHVHAISVDKSNNNLKMTLLSIMSGDKTLDFALDKVESKLVHNKGISRLLAGSILLEINVQQRKIFRITKRYGFSSTDLETIHELIQSAK